MLTMSIKFVVNLLFCKCNILMYNSSSRNVESIPLQHLSSLVVLIVQSQAKVYMDTRQASKTGFRLKRMLVIMYFRFVILVFFLVGHLSFVGFLNYFIPSFTTWNVPQFFYRYLYQLEQVFFFSYFCLKLSPVFDMSLTSDGHRLELSACRNLTHMWSISFKL